MENTLIEMEGTLLNVKPVDRLDTASAPKLKEDLLPYLDDAQEIVMDFAKLEYISSAGLRVLLEIYQAMEDKGGSLRIKNVSKGIMAIFNLVNFADIVTIE